MASGRGWKAAVWHSRIRIAARDLAGGLFVGALGFAAAAGTSVSVRADGAGNVAEFNCAGGKFMVAAYEGNSVELALSDGRSETLQQTPSGSGIRFASPDDHSFVFRNRGKDASLAEGSESNETYAQCVAARISPGGDGWKTYISGPLGFAIRYPSTWALDDKYVYDQLGPGKDIAGVSFTIPKAMTDGTNLSDDTRLSVERLDDTQPCNAPLFLPPGEATDEGTKKGRGLLYSFARAGDAGAGNFYEQQVYAVTGGKACIAICYFIHSTNIGNYDPGTVKAFDRHALLKAFNQIRAGLFIPK